MARFTRLTCPLDHSPLHAEGPQLRCEQGHSFDIGRPGYVNLLPVQHKRSRAPGDSKEMVAARHDFLSSGLYAPVAGLVGQALAPISHPGTVLLDAGCGEGYYLNELLGALPLSPEHCYGLDISKWAIQRAARRRSDVNWLVASNRHPPLASGSVDILLCMFGFQSYPGFSNVLGEGGHLVLVEAGPDHLRELREIIYPQIKEKSLPRSDAAQAAGLRLISSERKQYHIALNPKRLAQLLVMTPHLYRATAEGKAAAAALAQLDLTLDICIQILEKPPGQAGAAFC
ncbi:rRNA (guanine-N(1)-)-methyltransferase [Alcanivorax sp. S71-1-4]|uniref:putative RNA methyltransferase n=1 Tax=Alcanivorax sp. S71-1-4 TaxID=1177159 RepID=UPI0016B0F27F|nr:methyltransferase domain-containing protein [Alcanivorax sp. S71-1-4]KAF0807015.1 rRNA (guanine-N(1)-)-methyltransferase [Alcanivorax sp. S71-1-4]